MNDIIAWVIIGGLILSALYIVFLMAKDLHNDVKEVKKWLK